MKPPDMIKIGSPEITIYVHKSKRAKRLSIRISGANSKVFLIIPKRISVLEATQFALNKERWIRKQLKSKIDISKVTLGSAVPVEGFSYFIESGKNQRIKFEKNKILIPFNYTDFAQHLKVYLLELSRQRFFSKTNKSQLSNILTLMNHFVDAKLMLIKQMNKTAQLKTFLSTEDGFKVTGQEGYVAIDKLGKNAVKLVDRMEFSANNFNAAKAWDK